MARKYKKDFVIPAIFVFILLLSRFYYISLSARDVVFMDFWRNINNYVEPVMDGNFSWEALWGADFGQRNFLQKLLVVFDIKYTGLNCMWEEYAGIVVIAFSDIILLYKWIDIDSKGQVEQNNLSRYLILPVLLIPFCLQQWEILSLQFSFAFMIRIFCYYFILACVDKMLHEDTKVRDFILTGVFTALAILLVSQLYWPALLFTLLVTWIVDSIRKKELVLKNAVAYWTPLLLGVFLYVYGIEMSEGSEAGFVSVLLSSKYWMAIFYMFPGSLIPTSITESMTCGRILVIAALLILLVLVTVVLFFKFGLDKVSYFPMMLCAYGLFSVGIISYGRITMFDYTYMLSSRYTCETLLIWVGVGFTFAMLAKDRNLIFIVPLVIVFLFVGYADKTEMAIAPYRGIYKDELLSMMPKLDSYSDDELAGFQSPPELVREGNRLLQKYSLNIYRNLDLESQIIENE